MFAIWCLLVFFPLLHSNLVWCHMISHIWGKYNCFNFQKYIVQIHISTRTSSGLLHEEKKGILVKQALAHICFFSSLCPWPEPSQVLTTSWFLQAYGNKISWGKGFYTEERKPPQRMISVKKLLYFEWSPPWHFKSYILTYILTFCLTFYLTSILIFYLAYLPAFYLVYILVFYLAYILAFYVAFFLAYILSFYVAFYVAYVLAVYLAYILAFWHSIWPLRSSGAQWARKVPSWGPAVPTGLGRSLVEVQRCPLRSEPCSWGPAVPTQIGGRLLRSSSAHCARKLAKSEELARRKWTWKWRQRWWRRRRRRRRRKNSSDKI